MDPILSKVEICDKLIICRASTKNTGNTSQEKSNGSSQGQKRLNVKEISRDRKATKVATISPGVKVATLVRS